MTLAGLDGISFDASADNKSRLELSRRVSQIAYRLVPTVFHPKQHRHLRVSVTHSLMCGTVIILCVERHHVSSTNRSGLVLSWRRVNAIDEWHRTANPAAFVTRRQHPARLQWCSQSVDEPSENTMYVHRRRRHWCDLRRRDNGARLKPSGRQSKTPPQGCLYRTLYHHCLYSKV